MVRTSMLIGHGISWGGLPLLPLPAGPAAGACRFHLKSRPRGISPHGWHGVATPRLPGGRSKAEPKENGAGLDRGNEFSQVRWTETPVQMMCTGPPFAKKHGELHPPSILWKEKRKAPSMTVKVSLPLPAALWCVLLQQAVRRGGGVRPLTVPRNGRKTSTPSASTGPCGPCWKP